MKTPLTMVAAAGLALTACQTTEDGHWVSAGGTPFDQAERSCEEQTESIEDVGDRPEFFVGCMSALGWTPRAGTPYADPATAADPT